MTWTPDFSDLHHLSKLLQVPCDQVEERQLVEVLGPLVAHFNDLKCALSFVRKKNSSACQKTSYVTLALPVKLSNFNF